MKLHLEQIGNKLYSAFSQGKVKISNASPEIALAIGIGGVIAGAVLACRSTLKAEEIAKEAKEKLDIIDEVAADETKKERYSEDDCKKDKLIVYAQTGVKLLKVYAPAIIVETLSILSICKGHDILRKRNGALMAAYAALDRGYNEYRKRVKEEIGDEKEWLLHRGLKATEIDIPSKDEEGRDTTEKVPATVRTKRPISEYARLFGEGVTPNWEKSVEYNLSFVKSVQKWANNELRRRASAGVGVLFLNEVYDKLGFERISEGQELGWIFDKNNPNQQSFVDFGLREVNGERVEAFMYGLENSVWLDFNVDGLVRNYLPQNKISRV